ncbi:hypothetical protein [Solilutibacter pythonis]|uniref:hypothetical protein n=1 Tax=Solilutibacter pythonis TaxID=2483112 RepID=UPI001B87ED2D|nr:hypothetical protein [Lysobacter pythonis]
MNWLLLPAAAITLLLAMRTTSSLAMTLWLLLTVICLGLWVWLRYQMLFPTRNTGVELTPLDRRQLAHLRQQMLANRQDEADTDASAEPPTATGLPTSQQPTASVPAPAPRAAPPPAPPPAPSPAPDDPPPAPSAAPARTPVSGRAVFVLPDDPPLPAGPRDGLSK